MLLALVEFYFDVRKVLQFHFHGSYALALIKIAALSPWNLANGVSIFQQYTTLISKKVVGSARIYGLRYQHGAKSIKKNYGQNDSNVSLQNLQVCLLFRLN